MGSVKRWPNEMKHEMRQWDRDREWLARRFMVGWVALMVGLAMMGLGLHWRGAAVAFTGLGLLWSTRG